MFDALWLLADGRYLLWADGQPWQSGIVGIAGKVYRAKVERPSPALGGAFVTLGEQKALLKTDKRYETGDLAAVYVKEPAKGDKLAVVSDQVSLEGRYVVYLPTQNGVLASKRLAKEDKAALLASLHLPQGGFVVRAAAKDVDVATVEAEANALVAQWNALPPTVGYLYEAKPNYQALCNRAKEVLVDDTALASKLPNARYTPDLAARFAATDLELTRTVSTPEGVRLVFDHTEAAWVVDVNTGRYLPPLAPSLAAESANRIAAKELVRQLLLRDCTGMILVDFVSMPQQKGKELLAYLAALAIQYDSRLHVVDYTKLGVVELTREN